MTQDKGGAGARIRLIPHPAHPPAAVTSIDASPIRLTEHWLVLRWRVEGTGRLVVPTFAGKGRADGLWRTTCFELFLQRPGAATYCEFNLSPSERWAAYDFTAYREGMAERPMARDPGCTLRRGGDRAIFDVAIPRASLPALPCRMGLSAVIEEEGDVRSYWALVHPEGPADFHDPACFVAELPAPAAA